MSNTDSFYSLTPDEVLDAVDTSGRRSTGRCMALNSYENRVYDIELEDESSCVAKFYRPGRWSREQILEEHSFLAELKQAEVPVVASLPFPDGSTLHQTPNGLFFALFPKTRGRIPDELSDDQLVWVGRLIARIHNVGATRPAPSRLALNPETYGIANLEFLLKDWIPNDLKPRYEAAAREICKISAPHFQKEKNIRLHGDCHSRNLLWNQDGFFFLDFDDMVTGPPIQDLWLLLTEAGPEGAHQLEQILSGYTQMRAFNRTSLALTESLRALRYIHYTAWLARRWTDPAFPLAFPEFNSRKYWEEKTRDLESQLELIRQNRGP